MKRLSEILAAVAKLVENGHETEALTVLEETAAPEILESSNEQSTEMTQSSRNSTSR